MDDINKNIEEYNPIKKWKRSIVFDYMKADILTNEKLNLVVTEQELQQITLNDT